MAKSLFVREAVPMMLMAAGSILSLIMAIVIHEALIFLIFLWLVVVGLIDFVLEQRKNWWIRIHEAPASGRCGAYEFEFKSDSYANEFAFRNQSALTGVSKSMLNNPN